MARASITPEQIKEMNELYLKIKTYAGVSRAMGGTPSPTTVKKYIVENYVSEEISKANRKIFSTEDIPIEFNVDIFCCDNWGDLCILSDREKEKMPELWKEISI